MKLEDQVCSLEIAKKLKELGVKQESLFYWSICHDCEKEYPIGSVNWELSYEMAHGENICAFTSAELFEMLPACIDIKKEEPFNFYWLHLQKRATNNIQYILNYRCDTFGSEEFIQRILIDHNIYDENLSNALGKMLIHLIENNLIDLGKIND